MRNGKPLDRPHTILRFLMWVVTQGYEMKFNQYRGRVGLFSLYFRAAYPDSKIRVSTGLMMLDGEAKVLPLWMHQLQLILTELHGKRTFSSMELVRCIALTAARMQRFGMAYELVNDSSKPQEYYALVGRLATKMYKLLKYMLDTAEEIEEVKQKLGPLDSAAQEIAA